MEKEKERQTDRQTDRDLFHWVNFLIFCLSLGTVNLSRRMLKEKLPWEVGSLPYLAEWNRKAEAQSRISGRVFGGMKLMLLGRHFGVGGRDAEEDYLFSM